MVTTRQGQCLAAILFLCLAGNGVIFVLQRNGYSPFDNIDEAQSGNTVNSHMTFERYNESGKTKVMSPHNVKFVINHPDLCMDNPELVVIGCVSIPNFKQRVAIRDTWGSYAKDKKHKTKLLFLVGQSDDESQMSALLKENKNYTDIIQADFHDSYFNLSMKSIAMLKWVVTYCNSAKYLLKSDDDMYVNIPNLLTSLRKQPREKFILGSVIVNARPIQNKKSKWYTPKENFNEKVYPRYVSGTAYSMTTKAASDLYSASKKIHRFWLEDVYITGLCSRKSGVAVLNDNGFTYARRQVSGCGFKSVISGHRHSIAELYKIHKELSASPRPKC